IPGNRRRAGARHACFESRISPCSASLMSEIGNEAACFCAQPVYGRGCGDVQGAVILITPGKVRRLFWQDDGSKVAALAVPNPNAFGTGDEDIAAAVKAH